jgi:hypothetical protein
MISGTTHTAFPSRNGRKMRSKTIFDLDHYWGHRPFLPVMRKSKGPVHPLRAWRLAMKLSTNQVARMAGKFGRPTKGVYVNMIELGFARPGIDLAEALSRATRRCVTVSAILLFKQRRIRKAKSAPVGKLSA